MVAVFMAGDAMTPTFACGDLVVVDRAVDRISASGVYALVFDGEVTVRRVVRRSDGSVTITCDHPAYARWDEHFTRETATSLQVYGRLMWPKGA